MTVEHLFEIIGNNEVYHLQRNLQEKVKWEEKPG